MPLKIFSYCSIPHVFPAIFILFLLASCRESKQVKQERLYASYCSSCHLAPEINELPEGIWQEHILPEMGARLGIREEGFDPYKGLSMNEQYQIIQTGVYPSKPLIKPENWQLLKDYILKLAPDSLPAITAGRKVDSLVQFIAKPLALDSTRGSLITFMELNKGSGLRTGDISGGLWSYQFKSATQTLLGRFGRGITAYSTYDTLAYVTSVGYLDPSEIPAGRIFMKTPQEVRMLPQVLHRPVHTTVYDFNEDGHEELLISEYGDIKGALSLLVRNADGNFEKKVLLEQAGSIRTLIQDMNADGKDDILVLTAQGDEGITILFQKELMEFDIKRVLRFSPVYGTSWFETLDYDGDGDLDLVTVHGDNADKSYVHKPYHGLRIHINEGDSGFKETFFFPMNGATRVVARDFDKDGDQDFGILSTFPDYSLAQVLSFVYLENIDEDNFQFTPYTVESSKLGRWFLMDAGDIDGDGDEDIVLSSFTKYFSPVPKELSELWENGYTDIMLLQNKLIDNTQ